MRVSISEGASMACINPDGTLSAAAERIMACMQQPTTLEDAAQKTGLPLYRIRSSVREIVEAGLVLEEDGQYALSEAGKERIA
jgi:predicted transcriptional regulator